MAYLRVQVDEAVFDTVALQSELLRGECEEGGVVAFTGYVRAQNASRDVSTLELEHYPGMTEKSIQAILHEAAERWPLQAAIVVHRIGRLAPGEPIVWVGASSAHREAAFAASEFIMDYLKTRAPFWKKELGPQGERWVDARATDEARADRWHP